MSAHDLEFQVVLQRILIAKECVVEVTYQHQGYGDGSNQGQPKHIAGHIAANAHHLCGNPAVEIQGLPEADEVCDGKNQKQIPHDEPPAIVESPLTGVAEADQLGLDVGIGITDGFDFF